jgi:hypothetical protein
MIDEIALVIAISGVCSEWLTFQITWKPTKTASTKTMKCCMKLSRREEAREQHQRAPPPARGRPGCGSARKADLLRPLFLGRQFLRLFLGLGGGDRLHLGRRRRIGDRPVMGDGRAADHVILHVVDDHAILARREVRQHVADVGGVERGGLRRHARGEVGVADDGHAVVGDDLLVGHGQVAVAAALGREVDDDRAALHHLDHVLGPELRRGPAGDQRGGDDDVDLGGKLAELGELLLAELGDEGAA